MAAPTRATGPENGTTPGLGGGGGPALVDKAVEHGEGRFAGDRPRLPVARLGAKPLDAPGKRCVARHLTTAIGVTLAVIMRSLVAPFVAIAARYGVDVIAIGDGFLSCSGWETAMLLAVFTVVLRAVPALGLHRLWTRLGPVASAGA